MTTLPMTSGAQDPEELPLLTKFRAVSRTHVEQFKSRRDHVYSLLGARQNYSSGIFREGLLRQFLRELLPKAVSIDSGFIYGYDKVATSAQLDVIVWDSSRHSAVYRTDSFVIVPPESVIAVVSVKSRMTSADLSEAASNLLSIVPLDLAYRLSPEGQLPIAKFVCCFDGHNDPDSLIPALAEHFCASFAADSQLSSYLIPILAKVNIYNPGPDVWRSVDRLFPRLIVSLHENISFFRGWGPPDREEPLDTAHGIKRLPYLYSQRSQITTPFEKFIYHLLKQVYWTLDTPGQSLVSAWGDYDPRWGARVGADLSEVNESTGAALFDPVRPIAVEDDE